MIYRRTSTKVLATQKSFWWVTPNGNQILQQCSRASLLALYTMHDKATLIPTAKTRIFWGNKTREGSVSRYIEGLIKSPPFNPYIWKWCDGTGVWGGPSERSTLCWETLVSREAIRLIAIFFPVWSLIWYTYRRICSLGMLAFAR